MRKLLIVLVLVLTASAFYSALWFKSETIEADIRTRVTDDLAAVDAANIEIDVDGRHVTLSGIVNDQEAEAAYLDTADATFGALGPIDGLTYLADGGYFSAIKTDGGITLRGTVPSEDARAALVAEAQAATDGAVDDQLSVSGSAAAWQDEAGFGLTMLAGLSAGTMTVAADTFSVSGVAGGDPADITAAVADRAGWQAFVSSPDAEQQLSGDVARLTAEVSDRDATVGTLEAQVATVTSERDMTRQELETLRANLTEGETNTENLREQLIDTQSNLFEAEAAIEDRDQTVTALNGEVAALTEELAGSERRVTGADAMIAALSSNLADGGGEVTALSGQIEALQGQVATGEADLDAANQQVLDLQTEVGDANQAVADLTDQVADRDAMIADLNTQIVEGDAALGEANQQVSDLQGQVDLSNQAVVNLTAQLGDRDATIDGNVGAIADLTGQVATLNDTITDRDATIALLEAGSERDNAAEIAALNDQITVLEGEVANSLADGRSQVAALNGEITSRDATIRDLSGALEQAEGDVARLTRDLSDRDASVADASAQVSALTATVGRTESEVGDLSAQVETLEGDVGDLVQIIAERDDTIAALQSQGGSRADVAQQCATRASAAMEGGRINFGSATAQIERDSVALLERLTGIALACVGDGLSVEIGGHTDSQGTDAVNQELSEARAKAVVDFMTARGVPAAGLRAVGYGESQPIADNGTPAGRADNRRISFDWQAR